MDISRATYNYDSEVMGYHIYKDVWEPTNGEVLACLRETGNDFDCFAVSVMKDAVIVGHVPRRISSICSMFLLNDGTIKCEITGRRRYSRSIPQGGLEVPCRLLFEGSKKYVDMASRKLEQLRIAEKKTVGVSPEEPKEPKSKSKVVDLTPATKRAKLFHCEEIENDDGGKEAEVDGEWVKIFNSTLKISDRFLLLSGKQLTDVHINAAQKLLLHQFPTYQGLHNTLIQQCIGFWVSNYIQIWHCRQCHWITVSSIMCKSGEVNVYDSLYSDLDEITKRKLKRVFGLPEISVHFPDVQKQTGVADCGLFAIAFATNLAFGQDNFGFQQYNLQTHLKDCFEQKHLSIFP